MFDKKYFGIIFIVGMLIGEIYRYSKRLYYNDYRRYPKMVHHPLNLRFGLHHKIVDYDDINKILFISSVSVIITTGVIMYFNTIYGVISFFIFGMIIIFITNKYIVAKYSKNNWKKEKQSLEETHP